MKRLTILVFAFSLALILIGGVLWAQEEDTGREAEAAGAAVAEVAPAAEAAAADPRAGMAAAMAVKCRVWLLPLWGQSPYTAWLCSEQQAL
jgi:hypothetical protein